MGVDLDVLNAVRMTEDRTREETDFYRQQDLRSSEHYDAEAAARGEFDGDTWCNDPEELILD